MSNFSPIVSLVFEEMAEEENLFVAEHAFAITKLYATIGETQVKILEGIIVSRAERIHCSSFLLREAFMNAYHIEELKELPCRNFDEAILYLTSFRGAN